MIKVDVTGKTSLDKALKIFKAKFTKSGVVDELRERSQYTKKSVKRREKVKKAKYKEKMKGDSQN